MDGGDAGPSRQRQRARGESDAGGAGAAADAEWSRFGRDGRPAPTTYAEVQWGRYAPAIERWERLTRPAPAPTIPGTNGRPRLSPRFVEWMMGLPEGHVTGHGLRPAACLRMLGNGVVPSQAALALRLLLGLPATGVAAVEGLLPTPVADHSRGLAQPGSDYQSLPNVAISLASALQAVDSAAHEDQCDCDVCVGVARALVAVDALRGDA